MTVQGIPAKGLPASARVDIPGGGLVGLDLFDDGFLFPTMVLRESALAHNIRLFAEYCRAHGVDLAPHGKTTMVPQIFRRQLDAGAWGISVANVVQARVAQAAGMPRILIANEVVDDAGIDWIGGVLAGDGPEILCFVDSTAAVTRLGDGLGRAGATARRLSVLVEVGLAGGRAGVRTPDEALVVARVAASTPGIALAGVTFYEGIAAGATPQERHANVRAMIQVVRQVASAIDAERLLPKGAELIVTGGGSQYFDIVVEELMRPWPMAVAPRIVLRSGAYVTHDHKRYDDVSPFGSHAPAGSPRLQPALEVWSTVLSVPEPGQAIAAGGRRDFPYDAGMPIPIKVRRAGSSSMEELSGAVVDRLNDQHAYLAFGDDVSLAVGDRIAFGISHPCSAFDRWRFIPVVDDGYRVLDLYETIF